MRRLLEFLDEHAAQIIIFALAASVTILGLITYIMLTQVELSAGV